MKRIIKINPVWDMETLQIVSHDGEYEYSGGIVSFGGDKSKMRKLTSAQAATQAANAAADRARQLAATGKVSGVADQLMSTGAGKLSPWSSANYASNLDNISNTYSNLRGMGFRALNQSGFGSSPGATASLFNTAGRNMAADQTQAYRNALNDTLQQNLVGAQMEGDISRQYGGASQNESNMAVTDAAQRINEGSTFGDVMGGISAAAPLIAAPFTGGASLGFGALRMPGSSGQGPGGTPPFIGIPGSTSPYGSSGFGGVDRGGYRLPSYASSGVGRY